jgi:hypothetical protein
MKDNEYQCDACNGIFEKGWTDEEADQECRKNFGEIPENEKAVICDDCYKEFMEWSGEQQDPIGPIASRLIKDSIEKVTFDAVESGYLVKK